MIQILLATYNGEKYLSEQIDSIIAQSYKNWKILAHDDGSSDNSLGILKSYVDRYPDKIELIDDGCSTGGAKNNFSFLLSLSDAQYVAFCDQDDVWLENRLELGYKKIRQAEITFGESLPIIVCSDFSIVDEKLRMIADSGWSQQKNWPFLSNSIGKLAVRNYLTGCTMLINRVAINVSTPIPSLALMHDWWIGLTVLKSGGEILSIAQPTVLYRQHSNNVVGASKFSAMHLLSRIKNFKYTVEDNLSVYRMAIHAGAVSNWPHFLLLKFFVYVSIFTNHAA